MTPSPADAGPTAFLREERSGSWPGRAYERQQLAALQAQTSRHLAEVDAALDRVAAGTYGTSEVCGQPIPAGRLEARPTARTCVQHAALS